MINLTSSIVTEQAPVAPVAQAELSAASIVSATAKRNELMATLGEKMGEWKAYDSQLTIPEIAGTRIVKALYQTNAKTGKKLRENSYVRLPTSHITEEVVVARISELSPYVLAWLQELEAIELRTQHKKGQLAVFISGLSLDSIIAKLEESEAGARLNKEKIEAWYDSYLLNSLTVLFASKMGIGDTPSEEQLAKLEIVLNAYKAKFASLASGKVYIKESDCKAMLVVIRSDEDAAVSLLGMRFIARLEKMQEKEDDLLLAL